MVAYLVTDLTIGHDIHFEKADLPQALDSRKINRLDAFTLSGKKEYGRGILPCLHEPGEKIRCRRTAGGIARRPDGRSCGRRHPQL